MSPQSRRAEWLIHQAAELARTSTSLSANWPAHVACLQNQVRNLCADLAVMHGDDLIPAKGCEVAELILGDSSAWVEFSYRAGYPAKLYGPPENCYPEEDEEIEILRAYINGMWVDALDCFSQRILDQWAEQISERAAENARDRKYGEFA